MAAEEDGGCGGWRLWRMAAEEVPCSPPSSAAISTAAILHSRHPPQPPSPQPPSSTAAILHSRHPPQPPSMAAVEDGGCGGWRLWRMEAVEDGKGGVEAEEGGRSILLHLTIDDLTSWYLPSSVFSLPPRPPPLLPPLLLPSSAPPQPSPFANPT